MAGEFVFGWLFAKQNRQNGELVIDLADKGGGNDCGARYCCWLNISIALGGDREEDVFQWTI